MNHLFVGAVFPFLIGLLCYALARGRASLRLLILTPLAMLACATWAVLPDLPRTFGFATFDQRISMNPTIDLFFWHYTLNLHESYSPWFNIGFVIMLTALFGAAWRELRHLESPATRHPPPDTRHPTPATRHPPLDTRHPPLDTRHPTPDT